jgi:outer membrane protein
MPGMKPLGSGLVFGWCLLSLAQIGSAQAVQLTSLDDALKIGLERNLTVQEAAKRVQAAEATVGRATWLFLPKVDVDFDALKQQTVFALPPGATDTSGTDPGFFFGYPNQLSTRIRVEQPIFTGGRDINSLRIARLDLEIQRNASSMRRLDAQLDIARAYYGVLLAQQILKIREDLLAQNQRHKDDVARRLAAGDVARFDLLRAEVEYANVLPEVSRARNSVDVALAQLRNVLNLSREQPLTVTGAIDSVPDDTSRPDAFEQAFRQRPEVPISQLNRQVMERTVGATHAGWFPSVGAYVAKDFRSDAFGTLFDERHSNWMYGVSFTFRLDVGETLYKGRAEQHQAEALRLSQVQVERNIEVEVTRAVLELKRAAEVIASQKQNVRQAEEAMQIANTSYANGTITNLELMDTQVALDQARINYITAVYDYLIGLAQYRRSIGSS